MKASIKFATGLILAAGALLASGSIARAGEGGASGSVSIDFTTTTVGALTGNVTAGTVPGTKFITSGTGAGATTVPYTGPANNNVSNLSSSIAVGKSGAFSSAISDEFGANTSAIGSAGQLTITNPNTSTSRYESAQESAINLAISQGNNLSNGGTISGVNGAVSIP
jgi:hypothetical protein